MSLKPNACADTQTASLADWLKSLPLYLVPHHAVSRVVNAATRWRAPWWKNGLMRWFIARYGVDMSEAAEPRAETFEHFNAFFTRALKDGARPLPTDAEAVISPADGTISAFGRIEDGQLLQAKGHSFSLTELLGGDAERARAFEGGEFMTVYLSPRDYHRVHMPWGGRLTRTVHVPGRLFSVGPAAVARVPRLFARNERLVCHFDTDFGPMAVVMVGALLVSGVETVWSGEEIPAYGDRVTSKDYGDAAVELARFQEMARFNYGSTVIVLLPPGVAELAPGLGPETPVRLGQRLATRRS
jgi:phosphatidylserine decarboxylase